MTKARMGEWRRERRGVRRGYTPHAPSPNLYCCLFGRDEDLERFAEGQFRQARAEGVEGRDGVGVQGLGVVADVGGDVSDDGFTLDGVADGALGGAHFKEVGIGRGIADRAPHGGCVVGEIPVEADVHDGRQGLVDQFLQPDGGLWVLHLDDDADLGPLGGEGFHEGAVAGSSGRWWRSLRW